MLCVGSKVRYVIPTLELAGEGVITRFVPGGRCYVKDDDGIVVVLVGLENVEEVLQ